MANIVAPLYVPSLRVMGCCSKLWLEVLHVSDLACIHKYRFTNIACVLETFIAAAPSHGSVRSDILDFTHFYERWSRNSTAEMKVPEVFILRPPHMQNVCA